MGHRPNSCLITSCASKSDLPRSPTVDSESESGRAVLDRNGLEHIPFITSAFATSLPYTLTRAGTCSHRTCLPGLFISYKRSSHTGTFALRVPYAVVQPLDFQLWALPLAPCCEC